MNIIRLGFAGAHRTGKTSLAYALSQKSHIPFVKTETQSVFKHWGLDPAEKIDFKTRLWIQHQILQAALNIWQTISESFVTDRTPIDFMAYTLAELQGSTEIEFSELEIYLEQCFKITYEVFTNIIVIQPAIPLKYEAGKAAMNRAYMEHLNVLMKGLCHDEQMQCPAFVLPRKIVNLHERMKTVLEKINL